MNTIDFMTKLFAFAIMSAIVLIAATLPVHAAKGKKNCVKSNQTKLWQQIDESSLQSNKQRKGEERAGLPEKYLLFQLNNASLQSRLKKLPLENTAAAREKNVVMEIPMPDGTILLPSPAFCPYFF